MDCRGCDRGRSGARDGTVPTGNRGGQSTPMSRAPESARTLGFRQKWVSHAPAWSGTTRRLMKSTDFGSLLLTIVSFHQCLDAVSKLLDGYAEVPPDEAARADCPMDLSKIRATRDRAGRIRNLILHIGERRDAGPTVVHVDSHAGSPRTKWWIDDWRRGRSSVVAIHMAIDSVNIAGTLQY